MCLVTIWGTGSATCTVCVWSKLSVNQCMTSLILFSGFSCFSIALNLGSWDKDFKVAFLSYVVSSSVNSFIYFALTIFQVTSVRLEFQIHHSTWTYPCRLQHIWNMTGFSYVVLGIVFLLPLQHNLMCESWCYFCLLLVWVSWQQNCALSKVNSGKVCFDYCLQLPSLFVANLGTENEHLKMFILEIMEC